MPFQRRTHLLVKLFRRIAEPTEAGDFALVPVRAKTENLRRSRIELPERMRVRDHAQELDMTVLPFGHGYGNVVAHAVRGDDERVVEGRSAVRGSRVAQVMRDEVQARLDAVALLEISQHVAVPERTTQREASVEGTIEVRHVIRQRVEV